MAQDFIIKKGHSSRLSLLGPDSLIENAWYLTIDTAEVYVALKNESTSLLELKKLNECDIDVDFDFEAFDERLTALESEDKLHTYGYRSGFPTSGSEGHMYVAVDEKKSYVWFNNEYLVVSGTGSSYEEPDIIFGGSAN